MPSDDTQPSDSGSATASTNGKKADIRWDTLQDRLRSSVVSISICHTFHFDHEEAYRSNATGFVVDAEQGIILSNRHVMATGPSFHKATFFNDMELFLQPTYYDPIHDFAFFRYDPADLKNSFVPKEIKLAPEKARSGMEFRIVGNNSNEKMSVHQGELSQLDRNAPNY
ncbi:serine protease, partial [Coemansia furcata]